MFAREKERRYFQKGEEEEEEDNSRSFARSCFCCCSQSICDLLAHSFLESEGMTVTFTFPLTQIYPCSIAASC